MSAYRPRPRTLVLALACALSTLATAQAQDAAPTPAGTDASGEPVQLDRLTVTGSRIKRADVETSQPVFSLSREDIQAQGLTSVGDVIQNLSANGSTLYRTTFTGLSRERAVAFCNALKAAGRDCIVR